MPRIHTLVWYAAIRRIGYMTDARHIEAQINERLNKVIDPELGRSITDLGMIAAINAVGATSQGDGDVPAYDVTVHVELTVEGCPLSQTITDQINGAIVSYPDAKLTPHIEVSSKSHDKLADLVAGLKAERKQNPFNKPGVKTRIFAIASGKGGVGKSSVSANLAATFAALGYDTAANTAVECMDKLRDTMQSHERCAVVEVMGRHAGYLALYVGVAVGATAVLVPEHPYDFKVQVADNIRHARLNGKTNFMIVVAEGAASAVEVGRQIQEELALDPRVTILGHIQRGGSPTAKDRVMATRMGYEAVRVLAEGKTIRVICAKDDQIIDLDIDEGLAMKKTLNSEEFKVMTVMTGM